MDEGADAYYFLLLFIHFLKRIAQTKYVKKEIKWLFCCCLYSNKMKVVAFFASILAVLNAAVLDKEFVSGFEAGVLLRNQEDVIME